MNEPYLGKRYEGKCLECGKGFYQKITKIVKLSNFCSEKCHDKYLDKLEAEGLKGLK